MLDQLCWCCRTVFTNSGSNLIELLTQPNETQKKDFEVRRDCRSCLGLLPNLCSESHVTADFAQLIRTSCEHSLTDAPVYFTVSVQNSLLLRWYLTWRLTRPKPAEDSPEPSMPNLTNLCESLLKHFDPLKRMGITEGTGHASLNIAVVLDCQGQEEEQCLAKLIQKDKPFHQKADQGYKKKRKRKQSKRGSKKSTDPKDDSVAAGNGNTGNPNEETNQNSENDEDDQEEGAEQSRHFGPANTDPDTLLRHLDETPDEELPSLRLNSLPAAQSESPHIDTPTEPVPQPAGPAPANTQPTSLSPDTLLRYLNEKSDEELSSLGLVSLLTPQPALSLTIQPHRTSFYIRGRYLKHSRNMSQSVWHLGGGTRKTKSSVEEHLGIPIVEHLKADSFRFHGSGREDSDVRMLGTGRPFGLIIENARSLALATPDTFWKENDRLVDFEAIVNAAGAPHVQVSELFVSSPEAHGQIAASAETHRKHYQCTVRLERDVTPEDLAKLTISEPFDIQQQTPIRVLHRRAALTRQRRIFSVVAKALEGRFLLVDLVTAAGTYVKEWVHGDFGRTTPNLGEIVGCSADITQLDVMGVEDQALS
eukprot:c13823_g1_i2.p1 GENE.c13823_g1_i2~~c13823_g1_i2.p1  ORF type:complete len:591 (-),score=138.09 c13823_g1_i2:124-1896(-)